MKTRKRQNKYSLEEEERLDKTLLEIGAHCSIDHNYDWGTNEKWVYDAKRAFIELWQMARHLIKPAGDERGLTLREVKRFNSLFEGTHFFSPEFPDKQDLRLHLTEVLEKGIDPAQLRQILFWDITEFRTVILNALHARGEKLIPN